MLSKDWKYLLIIIVIFTAACIETDIYLPALTDMMCFFSVSESQIQSLLTWNFTGICISGPFYGPISDALGRKKPLLVALGLFFFGSLITLFSHTFHLMLLGRVLQGLGSGGCFTLGTAVIFDAFRKEKAIDALNKINSIVPFIMAAAPMLGGYLNLRYGFRSNFLAIAFFVLVSLLFTVLYFDETLPENKRTRLNLKQIANDFKRVSQSIPFWQTTVVVCLIFTGYLVFLSNISVLFIMEHGIDKKYLPLYQGALLGAWLIANLTCRQMITKWGIPKVKRVGTLFVALGGILLALFTCLAPHSSQLLTFSMVVYAFGGNWTQGLYFPEGMEIFPDIKGITASLLTSFRLLISSVVLGFTASLYNSTIYPISYVLCGVITVILYTIIMYERNQSFPRPKASHDSTTFEVQSL